METVRYLPLSDLAVPFNLRNAKNIIYQIQEQNFSLDINNIVSVNNILRYLDDGLEEQLENPNKASLKAILIDFIRSNSPTEILTQLSDLPRYLDEDFWSFFIDFKIEKKVSEEDFRAFLFDQKPNLRAILLQSPLRNRFRRSLREYFLSDIENVSFLIARKEIWFTSSPVIPKDISAEDECLLVHTYINSDNPFLHYLEIFAKSRKLPPRIKLAAKRRAESITEQIFNSSTTFNFGVEVSYRIQNNSVKAEFIDGVTKYSYDLNWIQDNLDRATLLNNFIYLFDYIDDQSRLTLCFQISELSTFERELSTQRTDWLPNGLIFTQKNQAALLQLHSYSMLLNKLGTSIEKLINWFFREYIKVEFEIGDFEVDLPMGNRPFIEKCKLLLPEIERILRQFQLLVEDGDINHELIALETNSFVPSSTKSFLEKKYCYLESKDGKRATYYFFSDQCMLNYDSFSKTSYESFIDRLSRQKLYKKDFEIHQIHDLIWLEENGYIQFDEEEAISVTNKYKVIFLHEIFRNGCLCYKVYQDLAKETLDTMIAEGTLRVESSLFSEPEAEYLDYHLNQRRFINSLDLRNIYAHGSYSATEESEQQHEINYFQMLKIIVFMVLKINDELCQKNEQNLYLAE